MGGTKIDRKAIEKDLQWFINKIYPYYSNNRDLLEYISWFAEILKEEYGIKLSYL